MKSFQRRGYGLRSQLVGQDDHEEDGELDGREDHGGGDGIGGRSA